jgi:O-antigen/teichoic acid export membrane protein
LGATIAQVLAAAVTLIATIAVLNGGGGPTAVVAVSGVTTIAVSVYLIGLARRGSASPLVVDRATMRHLARETWPVAVSMVGVIIYRRIDQLLLGGYGEVRDLAQYAAAVRLVDALNIVPLALAAVALPALSHFARHESGREKADRLLSDGSRFLASLILPLAALATAVGGAILALLYGDAYRTAAGALAVLLWAHFFGFTGVLVDQALIARGQSKSLALLTIIGAAVNVAIDLWAIPRYGGIGAAWGSLIAYTVPFVGGLMMPSVREVFRRALTASVRPLVAALLVLGVLLALRPSGALVIPIFGAVTVIALFGTRSIRLGEIRELIAAASSGGAVAP